MELEVKLFEGKRDYLIFFAFLSIIFFTNITLKYNTYKNLTKKPANTIYVTVINQYQKTKHDKTYIVMKLRSSDGYTFYTTSREDLKDLIYDKLRVKIVTKNIHFIDLFKGFYAPTFSLELMQKNSLKEKIVNFISSQHENNLTKELFSALFLAKPISKDLRAKVSNLGISHLIAISGFHLGVLFFILYTLLKYPYQFFQDRFFPYRNRRFDLTVFIIGVLFLYLYLLGFIPSLVRSYVMLIVGFVLYDRFVKVISFEVLIVAVLLILAFIPSFFFSLGFWFSVSGVFYIYLFLKYFLSLKEWQIVLLLNIWVYIMMLPIIHYIFPKFTFLQLLSPLLSIAFIIFYPLELFLHLIGQGGLLDGLILKLFDLKSTVYQIHTPLWFLVLFVGLSFFVLFL